jgi:hypothetical protein
MFFFPSLGQYTGDLAKFLEALETDVARLSKSIGEKLSGESPFVGRVVGVGAQYRGTIISGRRGEQNYYYADADDLDLSRKVTKLYFDLFEYSDTIGEVFQDFVLADQSRSSSWHILTMELKADGADLSYSYEDYGSVGLHHLTYSRALVTELWPDAEVSMAKESWEEGRNHPELERRLAYLCHRQALRSLPSLDDRERGIFDVLCRFVNEDVTATDIVLDRVRQVLVPKIERILRAIQAFSLYGLSFVPAISRSTTVMIAGPADRHVVAGELSERLTLPSLSFLAPRIGVAIWLKASTPHSDDNFDSNFSQKAPRVLEASILKPFGAELESIGSTLTSLLTSPDRPASLTEKDAWLSINNSVACLLRIGPNIARVLTMRVRAMAENLERIAPKAQYEGTPVPLAWLLGREYHEQVCGLCLEDVSDFTRKLAQHFSSELFNGVDTDVDEIEVLEPLIKNRITLLDWPGTIMFFAMAKYGYRHVSLRRLGGIANHEELPTKLAALTSDKLGLFAFLYQPGLGIRLYCAGTLIGRCTNGSWVSTLPAETIESLAIELASRVIGGNVDLPTIEPFCRALTRISETPGSGALFVLAKERGRWMSDLGVPSTLLEMDRTIRMPRVSDDNDAMEKFYRMCILDGATVLVFDQNMPCPNESWRNAAIFTRRKIDAPLELRAAVESGLCNDASTALRVVTFGARRTTALALAASFPGDVGVISVSADGPINFLLGQRAPNHAIQKHWPR